MKILDQFPDIAEAVKELEADFKRLKNRIEAGDLYSVAASAHLIRMQARTLEHLVNSKNETEPKLKL